MALTRGRVLFLEFSDGAGAVFLRWQDHWMNQVVSFDGQQWIYQRFSWVGITSGASTSDQASISMSTTPQNIALVERCLRDTSLANMRLYDFDEEAGDSGPPAGMILIGSVYGQIVSSNATGFTTITMSLGSALSPIGAQYPPRTYTTALVGVPCRLG